MCINNLFTCIHVFSWFSVYLIFLTCEFYFCFFPLNSRLGVCVWLHFTFLPNQGFVSKVNRNISHCVNILGWRTLSLWTELGLVMTVLFFFLIIVYLFIFIFIFGCVGSSFLREGFLQLRQAGATPHRGARASSLSRPLLLRSTGSKRAGSVVVAHGPSCSAACGIFPDQGSNPCPLH